MSPPQLPVHSYFDPDLFALEQERIFRHAARYVGHEKLVPEPGDWHTLAQEGSGRALLRTHAGVQLLSNVCRHRQAVMLGAAPQDGKPCSRGNLDVTGGNIVCPIHRWTYNTQGALIGAPQFAQPPCLHLQTFPVRNCHGLLFEGARDPGRDMAALFARPAFDLSDYVYDHTEVHHCRYNWKTFIEVYLEDYHVAPFHPGLGRFVRCEDLSWEFSDWYSLQRVGGARCAAPAGLAGLPAVARPPAAIPRGRSAGFRCDLGDVLSHAHDRAVPARGGALDPVPR